MLTDGFLNEGIPTITGKEEEGTTTTGVQEVLHGGSGKVPEKEREQETTGKLPRTEIFANILQRAGVVIGSTHRRM